MATRKNTPPECETLTSATYLQAAAVPLTNLFELASHFPPQLATEVRGRLASIQSLMRQEGERLAKQRPSFMRLVVDNEMRS